MHSVSAVEGQPVNNLIFGLAPGLGVHAMQAFNLQRAEKRFRHRVVALLTLTGSQQLPFRLIDPRMP